MLMCNFINKSNHMMLSCNTNKLINEKKVIYIRLLNNIDKLSMSLLSAYTIYFAIICYLLDKIRIMNNRIRTNKDYDDKKICSILKLIDNLKLTDINYKHFFLVKDDNIIDSKCRDMNVFNHKNEIICKSLFKKLEII